MSETVARVWKFGPLDIGQVTAIDMPVGSRVVHFGVQDHRPYLWAISNPMDETTRRLFLVIPTGMGVPPDGEYIATTLDGALVWHLFGSPS